MAAINRGFGAEGPVGTAKARPPRAPGGRLNSVQHNDLVGAAHVQVSLKIVQSGLATTTDEIDGLASGPAMHPDASANQIFDWTVRCDDIRLRFGGNSDGDIPLVSIVAVGVQIQKAVIATKGRNPKIHRYKHRLAFGVCRAQHHIARSQSGRTGGQSAGQGQGDEETFHASLTNGVRLQWRDAVWPATTGL